MAARTTANIRFLGNQLHSPSPSPPSGCSVRRQPRKFQMRLLVARRRTCFIVLMATFLLREIDRLLTWFSPDFHMILCVLFENTRQRIFTLRLYLMDYRFPKFGPLLHHDFQKNVQDRALPVFFLWCFVSVSHLYSFNQMFANTFPLSLPFFPLQSEGNLSFQVKNKLLWLWPGSHEGW